MTLAVRILALGLLALAGAGTSEAKDVVIQAGTLIDGVSEAPLRHEGRGRVSP